MYTMVNYQSGFVAKGDLHYCLMVDLFGMLQSSNFDNE